MLIEWTKDYELGIPKIDTQHQKLVEIINRLFHAHDEEKGQDTVNTIFMGLFNYCNYHFAIEEMVMGKHAYDEYHSHKKRHDLFTDKMKSFKRDYLMGDSSALQNTVNYLKGWLIDHILVEDKKYVLTLKDKFR